MLIIYAVVVIIVILILVELKLRSIYSRCRLVEGDSSGKPVVCPYSKPCIWSLVRTFYSLISGSFRNGAMERGWNDINKGKLEGALAAGCVQSYMFSMRSFQTWDAEMARQILFAKESEMGKTRIGSIQEVLLGNSILLEEGPNWKKQHDLLSPAFGWEHIKAVQPHFVQVANDTAAAWKERSMVDKNTGVEIYQWMQMATLDMLGKAGFDLDFQAIKSFDKKSDEVHAYEDFIQELLNPIHFWEKLDKLVGTEKRMYRIIDRFQQYLKDLIKIKEKKFADLKSQGVDPMTEAKDILDLLVIHHKTEETGEEGLTDSELLSNCVVFYLAGHETTAGAIANNLFYLALNPDVQRKCQEEIDRILPNSTTPTYDDIKEMHYLQNCVKESLRLSPPAAILMRTARTDLVIGGYSIAKGTNCMVNTIWMHRNKQYWSQPNEFRPERFDNKDEIKRPSYAWQPFSVGPRQCIGNNFAQLEIRTTLCVLLKHFNFAVDPNSTPFSEHIGVVICPPPGAKLLISSRK